MSPLFTCKLHVNTRTFFHKFYLYLNLKLVKKEKGKVLKRTFFMILLIVFLTGILASAFDIQQVEASGTIYILADGSIDPPTAPISTFDMVTYTFTHNIYDEIVVMRSNIIVDGNGHTLQGSGNGNGFYLPGINNVTVKNTYIKNFEKGIKLNYSLNNSISQNHITNNSDGIYLWSSSNNSISGNNITSNNEYGMYLESSSGNSISGNTFTDNGLFVRYSYPNSVENNTVNGKPLVYLEDVSDYTVGDAGQVILVRSENIRVEGLNLSRTDVGIELWETGNSTISGNNITNNDDGISLWSSSNNSISGNNISNNRIGILLGSSSNYNSIVANVFVENGLVVSGSYDNMVVDNLVNGKPLVYLEHESDVVVGDAGQVVLVNCNRIQVENLNLSNASVGVQLWQTSDTTLCRNNMANNSWYGIWLYSSSDNSIRQNQITNNRAVGIYLRISSNNSISRNTITNNDAGIFLWDGSNYNNINGNSIIDNNCGISFWSGDASNNGFYHNDFINNTLQVFFWVSSYANIWDNGYPSGGNYWSDYTGVDEKSGPNQDLPGSDGIGDTPYVIDANNQDHYPFMNPWTLPNIAITNVSTHRTVVGAGFVNSISVTVENQGNYLESFNVMAYYDHTAISVHEQWLTIEQRETFWSEGDVNRDGYVFDCDINIIAVAFGSKPGDSNWNPDADLDQNLFVGMHDLNIASGNYGLDAWTHFGLSTNIADHTVVTLPNGTSTTVVFRWNTTNVAKGNYVVSAYVESAQGDIDLSDNSFTDGSVLVTIPGDVEVPYFEVDIYDFTGICVCYDSKIGESYYYPNYDVDGNCIIDIYDVTTCGVTYGQKDP
jgi:parallel beta-helix repeat protein